MGVYVTCLGGTVPLQINYWLHVQCCNFFRRCNSSYNTSSTGTCNMDCDSDMIYKQYFNLIRVLRLFFIKILARCSVL